MIRFWCYHLQQIQYAINLPPQQKIIHYQNISNLLYQIGREHDWTPHSHWARIPVYSLKKQIKLIEFDEKVEKFILNLAYPLRKFQVTLEGKKITIKGDDVKTKSLLIGRDRANLKNMISIVKRYFDVEDIIVI